MLVAWLGQLCNASRICLLPAANASERGSCKEADSGFASTSSMRSLDTPSCSSSAASDMPTGPAPTIVTSNFLCILTSWLVALKYDGHHLSRMTASISAIVLGASCVSSLQPSAVTRASSSIRMPMFQNSSGTPSVGLT